MKLWQRKVKLRSLDYREARQKPDLFYRTIEVTLKEKRFIIVFFADTRRTERRRWRTLPICYTKCPPDIPEWLANRVERSEIQRIIDVGIPFGFWDGREDYLDEIWEGSEDGHCKHCGRDFQDRGLLCPECHLEHLRETVGSLPECEVEFCRVKVMIGGGSLVEEWEDYLLPEVRYGVNHHTCYAKDETITVCQSCHGKIGVRKDPRYKRFWPVDTPKDIRRKKKIVPCSRCSGNARVEFDLEDTSSVLCHKCKKKQERLAASRVRRHRRRSSDWETGWYSPDRAIRDRFA